VTTHRIGAVDVSDGSESAGSQPSAAGPRLVVANHRPPLDIPLLLRQFGGVVLSRADLATWPVLVPAALSAETILVDHADTTTGVVAARTFREQLSRGRTVIVFSGRNHPCRQ